MRRQLVIPSNDPAGLCQVITLAVRLPVPPPADLHIPAEQLQLVAAVARQCNRLLAQLAAAVDSGSGGKDSSSSGGSGGGDGAEAGGPTLGQLCLEPSLAAAMDQGLSVLVGCCSTASGLLRPGMLSNPDEVAAACAVAEALLRLQPSLMVLPADAPLNKPANIVSASLDEPQARLVPVWALHQAGEASQHAARSLLRACEAAAGISGGSSTAMAAGGPPGNTEAADWYAFHLANSALQWMWLKLCQHGRPRLQRRPTRCLM